MDKLVICKVCGFVMREKDLKDVCPACGVPKTAFIEYKYPINENRQKKLNLHLHPITVHFPEAIAVFSVALIIFSYLVPGDIGTQLIITYKILSVIFPPAIIVASISGIYDAKIRFKKLSPPYLRVKMYLGILLFISSMLTITFLQYDYSTVSTKSALIILSMISALLSTALGKLGGRLMDSRMPG